MAKSDTPSKSSRAESPKAKASAAAEASETSSAVVAPAQAPAAPAKRRPIDLIEGAKRQLRELTCYPVDSASEFGKTDDGWKLTVNVVELNRIPPATDVLAEYVMDLDEAGNVVGYHRGRRYSRGQVGDPE